MACNTLSGNLLKDCDGSIGGIKEIRVIDIEDVKNYHINNDGVIDAIYTSGNLVSLEPINTFVKLEFNKNTAFYTEELQTNKENSSSYHKQTLQLAISRRDNNKRGVISDLIKGLRDCLLLVKDQNGFWWALGKDHGMYVNLLNGGSGTTLGDRNGYEIGFDGEESEMAYEVDPWICQKQTVFGFNYTWTYGTSSVSTDGDWDAILTDTGFGDPLYTWYLEIGGEMYEIIDVVDDMYITLNKNVEYTSGTNSLYYIKCKKTL